MKKEPVILIGSGGHALIVADIIEQMDCFEIIGIISSSNEKHPFLNYPILGNDDCLEIYFNKGIKKAALGIGGYTSNELRASVFHKLKGMGFSIATAIHPKSTIAKGVAIGEGSCIFAGVVLNPAVSIGKNSIIATSSSIDHETKIGNHVLVSAGATIGANVIIDDGVLCALGTKIISGIHISKNSLIAAGAVVVNHLPENSKVFGVPAKPKQ
jgi:sugar O-acyltransferase (sialic acid O-acetyltransferase NeuD family)